MVIRIDSGVARYGLPGLILGLAMAWVFGSARSGSRGPDRIGRLAGAEAGGGTCVGSDQAAGARPVAGGEVPTGRWL